MELCFNTNSFQYKYIGITHFGNLTADKKQLINT